jgi:hypothetical protein
VGRTFFRNVGVPTSRRHIPEDVTVTAVRTPEHNIVMFYGKHMAGKLRRNTCRPLLAGLLFDPEDGGDTCLRNVRTTSQKLLFTKI